MNMTGQVPNRIANILINALKGGVVPRVGLEYITVGRTQEISALLHDIEMIEEGGASFRFIVGKYGSGKSFLLQTIRNYATAKGFAVVDADLSPERRFAGTKGQGLATYKELIQNLSTKSKPDGGALPLILEKWISGIQASVKASSNAEGDEFDALVERQIYGVAGSLEGMVNGFEFAKAVVAYWKAYRQDDPAMKSNVLKWFRGEYPSRKEAKDELGINFIVTDETWYDFLKLFAAFLTGAGYKGLLVIIDELVNIFKISNSITRANNYEKILTIYNDVLQGKASHIGFLMGGTPQHRRQIQGRIQLRSAALPAGRGPFCHSRHQGPVRAHHSAPDALPGGNVYPDRKAAGYPRTAVPLHPRPDTGGSGVFPHRGIQPRGRRNPYHPP